MFFIVLLFLISYIQSNINCAKFPNELTKCNYGDSECILTKVNDIFQNKHKGFNGLLLPSLDPLHIRKLNLVQGSGHRVNIELYFNEIDILGLSNATAYKASGFDQVPSEYVDFRFMIPMLMIKGPYQVNGLILFLPLNGRGESQLILANDVQICRFDDHDCLLASANYVLKHYSNGNPDLGLEPIEPFKIDSMTVDQNSGPVKILAKITNFDIVGFSGAEIYKLSGFENDLIDLCMKMPFATLAGPYKINGNILILPVNGAGKMRLHFKNFDIKMKLPVVKEIRDGKTFMKIEKPEMTFDITGGDVNLSHLGSFANGFLNSNFNRIISLINPAISKSLVEKLTHRINSVLATMSYNELFTA